MKRGTILVLLLIIAIPFTFSDVIISEIMYSGSNNYDWFEIYNTGTSINLSQLNFYENNNRHELNIKISDEILENKEYAIIANDWITFNLTFSFFNATLIDSSFSLPSTGRKITINNTEYTAIVYYNSSFGGNKEETSLSLINGTWIESVPTPGYENRYLEQNNNYDLSISSNTPTLIGWDYENFFTIRNTYPKQNEKINVTIKYNITKDEFLLKEEKLTFFEVYQSRTAGTGKYTFNETGNYTLCGEIINSTINNSNSTNDQICYILTVIDTAKINCDIAINISSEEIFNDTIKFSFDLNNETVSYEIIYYVTDLFDKIIEEEQKTQNNNQKTITPDDYLQTYIIHALILPYCNDTDFSNNNVSKMVYVKHTEYEEEFDPESYIDVSDIYLGTDEKVKFGSTFRVPVAIYKGETTNNSVNAYVQDEFGNKISTTTSFNIYDNYAYSDFTIPILLNANCNKKLPNGEYDLIIEGLGAINSQIITIDDIDSSSCQEVIKECGSSSSKSSSKTESESFPEENSNDKLSEDKNKKEIIFPKHIFANEDFEILFTIENTKNKSQNYYIYSYAYKGNKAYSESREGNAINLTFLPYETKNITLKDKVLESGVFSYKVRVYREGIKTPKEITDTIYSEDKIDLPKIKSVFSKGIINDEAILNVKVGGGDLLVAESLAGDVEYKIKTKKTFDIKVLAPVYKNVYYLSLYENESITDFTRIEVINEYLDNTTNYEESYSNYKSGFLENSEFSDKEVSLNNKKVNSEEAITGDSVYFSKNYRNKNIVVYFIVATLALLCIFLIIKKKK